MPLTEDAAASSATPEYIGRYRVVERLGKGTMGMVYAAEDEMLGRRVAVKVMMTDLEEEPEVRERFYREAKVTGTLIHRNIVTVFDFGEDRGHPYIVMELLAALPLVDHLRTPAAASLDAKIDLMMQTCEGLQVAHSHGVVHRDIKPTNLFVQRDGTLKILDFGVARLAASHLTLAGVLVGTPEYMSPEQARAKPIDGRSDVFSAGAVFYMMLAGRGPFASPDLPKILRAVVNEDPAPLSDAEAPEALRRVLGKALAKAPADRYQQCAQMLADLEQVRRTYDATTRRIVQAALDRYRQTLALIEERRTLGRSLGTSGVETACDEAAARLTTRFPSFAAHVAHGRALDPMDRAAANATLESLQARHSVEVAALAAARAAASDVLRTDETSSVREARASTSTDGRATSLWRRFTAPRGRS